MVVSGAANARGTQPATRRVRRRPGLESYLERRLGRGSMIMLRNWLIGSFGGRDRACQVMPGCML
jgi:hypothetical protein